VAAAVYSGLGKGRASLHGNVNSLTSAAKTMVFSCHGCSNHAAAAAAACVAGIFTMLELKSRVDVNTQMLNEF
jgi:uncharacterized metal-binding protein